MKLENGLSTSRNNAHYGQRTYSLIPKGLSLKSAVLLLLLLPGFPGLFNPALAYEKKPAAVAYAEFYVSVTGSASGDGSINNPWDLQTAFNQPSAVQPGSTIWVKPGTYKGTFISNLTGTSSTPIQVKAAPGGRVIIDGSRAGQAVKNVTTFEVKGAYTWYVGFEVTNSDPQRVITQSGSNPPERRGEGVYVLGKGVKIINFVIYDTGEGISAWTSAENSEYYGNVIFNNGWFAPDREHGHGIYTQNNTGTKSFIDNIVLNNFGFGWQFYGSQNASLKNFYIEGNVMLNDRWLIGGSTPAENIDVNTNFTYKDTIEFGYTNNVLNSGLTLRNNVFSSNVLLNFWKNVTATNNRFYTGYSYGFPITMMFNGAPDVSTYNFNNNNYYWSNPPSPYQAELAINWVNFPLPDTDKNRRGNFMLTKWRQMGKDVNSTLTYFPLIDDRNYKIGGSSVYVRKNKYDAKRATLIIYNYDKLDNISVDVAGVLSPGDSYELHNVQNYFGDVVTGVYSGGQLSVPMNNHTVAKPIGYNYELGKNTQKEFGTFVLIKTTAAPVNPVNAAPIARAGADVSIQLPVNSATLNGNQSTDADGSVTSYSWTKISGPSQPAMTGANTAAVSLSGLVEGVYVYRLTVTDNNQATASDDVQVTVSAAAIVQNKLPVTNAGINQTIQLPVNSVVLDASGSSDPDGKVVGFNWQKMSGPSSFTFSQYNTAAVTVSNLVEGYYIFRATITDNSGGTSYGEVMVTVKAAAVTTENKPPVANAGSDITLVLPANSTTLNASQSYDPDGNIATYNWTKIAGPYQYGSSTPSSLSNTISDLAVGTYTFRLTVTDNKGLASSDEINIIVTNSVATNKLPVANAGTDVTIQLPVNYISLNGGQSSDADGQLVSYTWSKLSGPSQYSISSSAIASPQLTNLAEGTYTFRLTVKDNSGATAYDDMVLTVTPANSTPPVASAGTDETIPAGQSTVLHGEGSTAAAGIKSYSWTKYSGPSNFEILTPTSASTWIRNMVAGTYVFRLTVTDNKGATCTDDVNINVTSAASSNLAVNIGSDITLQLPVDYAYLRPTVTVASDRYVSFYKWEKISGPSQSFITSTNSLNTMFTNLVAGTYTFRLSIGDNKGGTAYDNIIVTVKPVLSSATASGRQLEEIQENSSLSSISLFPNPVHNMLQLKWNTDLTGTIKLKILNVDGKMVKSQTFKKESKLYNGTFDISSLEQGMYIIELSGDNGKSLTRKFIKE